jgi:hypothetical protein
MTTGMVKADFITGLVPTCVARAMGYLRGLRETIKG